MAFLLAAATQSHAFDSGAGFADMLRSKPHEVVHAVPVEALPGRSIPEWMDGLYVRNVPSLHGLGGRNFTHMFDAFSKLHAWTIANSSAFMSARFTPSVEWNKTQALGSPVPVRLLGGIDPAWNQSEWMDSLITFPDNAGINVWRFGSEAQPKLASTTDEMVF